MIAFLKKLQRRNVIRVAIAYVVVSYILIHSLHLIFPEKGPGEEVFTNLYIFLAAGFVIAAALAWTYEITPAGLVLAKNVERSKSFARNTGEKLNRIIIVLLVVAIGLFLYDFYN